MKKRILVCRTDKLGDVLLSLPALVAVQEALGERYAVDFLVAESLVELLGPFLTQHGIEPVSYPAGDFARSWEGALCLFYEPAVARFLKQASIPLRTGSFSKVGSVTVFNSGRWQRRSQAKKSEAEYGLELAQCFVRKLGGELKAPSAMKLPANAEAWKRAQSKMHLPTEYWVLHPGMGGSAENLSLDAYARLAAQFRLQHPGLRTLVVMGPAPADQAFTTLTQWIPDSQLVSGLSLAEYAEVLRRSRFVIAPSTGPLHLAHWVGTKTLGLFSPVRSQHARRWAPFGGTGQSTVWWPDVACPGKKNCLGARCRQYFCMEKETLRGSPVIPFDTGL